MAVYGQQFFIAVQAISASTGQPYSGDLATGHVTLRLNRDGTDITFGGTPVEDVNGVIGVTLTNAEASGNDFILTATSTTSGVVFRSFPIGTLPSSAVAAQTVVGGPGFGTAGTTAMRYVTGPAAGYYADQNDLQDEIGIGTLAQISNLDGTATGLPGNGPIGPDTGRIQRALNYADDTINNTFRNSRYAVPLVVNSASSTVTQWAVAFALEWLYRPRGQRDDDPNQVRFTNGAKQAKDEINRYLIGQRFLDATLSKHVQTQPQIAGGL
jgi:hypothetical protein